LSVSKRKMSGLLFLIVSLNLGVIVSILPIHLNVIKIRA
jgi:hypothetical protein